MPLDRYLRIFAHQMEVIVIAFMCSLLRSMRVQSEIIRVKNIHGYLSDHRLRWPWLFVECRITLSTLEFMKMAYLKLKQYRSPIFPLSVLHNKDLSKKLTSLNHTVFLLYIILDKDLAKPKSGAPDYNRLNWLKSAMQSHTRNWAAVN